MTDTAPPFQHAQCEFKSLYGKATLHIYSFGPHEEDNVLCIEVPDRASDSRSPLVRVQSACYTAEIFRSTDCDCHEQLEESLRRVHDEGGYVVYMICDGRGAGLLTKVRGLALGETDSLDTFDAYQRLGVSVDPRDYARVAEVLKDRNLHALRLLTNNPRKVEGLRDAGLEIERVPLEIEPTRDSWSYLKTKQEKFGHLFEYRDFPPA